VRAAAVACVIAIAGGAHAQPSDDTSARAKALYDEATKQYDLRDYVHAIDNFRKAYDLLPDALFLFDIAQSYRQLRDCENASAFYKTYLRNAPQADNRDRVEKFVTEMDDCAQQQRTQRDQAQRDQAQRERAQRDADAARLRTNPPPANRYKPLETAGLITAGVGAIATGFAVYFAIDAYNQARNLEAACQMTCEASDVIAIDSQGHDSNRNAVILFAFGGAAIAAGAGMFVWAKTHETETFTVAPAPVPGGATVQARWRF
jgi:tetratricopeptide (TPR) repeat protein